VIVIGNQAEVARADEVLQKRHGFDVLRFWTRALSSRAPQSSWTPTYRRFRRRNCTVNAITSPSWTSSCPMSNAWRACRTAYTWRLTKR
jgi:hypothetical protein